VFELFDRLSTPLVADACVRCAEPLRVAPAGLRAVVSGERVAGRALPARHYGSVDVFLEALTAAEPGDVLVIDNGGRIDEACIGDLVVLEAQASGVAALAVWGLHRDTPDIVDIGVPVFSYGSLPVGPLRLDERDPDALTAARFGPSVITREDAVFADDDGMLFVPMTRVDEVLDIAHGIWEVERQQADRVRSGDTLRRQTAFDGYLERRARDPAYTFRAHLRRIKGAIEE